MSRAIVYIDGLIGTWEGEKGIELTDVISQIKQYGEIEEVEVHIDSIGGVVQTGFDIYNYLKSLNKPITTITESFCASIATVVFLAGSKRLMRPNASMMIHNPWAQPAGDASALQEYSNELRKIEKQLIDFYDKNTGIGKEALSALMRDETEMSADEAVKLGFATGLAEEKQIVAYFKPNNSMSKQKKTLKEQLKGILAKLGDGAVDLTLQDATGQEIVFETENETPSVGDKATVDGKPANGEYTMPDGTVYVFEEGELKEIKNPQPDPNAEELKNTIREIVQEEMASIREELTEGLNLVVEATDKLTENYTTLAKSVKSKFQVPKKEGNKLPGSKGDDVYSKYRKPKKEED